MRPALVDSGERGSPGEFRPCGAVKSAASVEPVAEALGVVEGERDQGGGDITREVPERDADLFGCPEGS